MVQISDENCKPFWSMLSERVRKIPPPSPPLSKDEILKDIEHIMSTGNLILDVNSVAVSYLIHYNSLLQNTTILLQNAIVLTKCDIFITSYSV